MLFVSLSDLTAHAASCFQSGALRILRCLIYLLGARYMVRSHADDSVPVRLPIPPSLSLREIFVVRYGSDNCGAHVAEHSARRLRLVENVAGV